MIQLKVRKFGNSLGVILPKELIQRLPLAARNPEGSYSSAQEAQIGPSSMATIPIPTRPTL
ncbi:MAG: hypothetical protein ABL967_09085 [Bryobacteraceae bacterium]